MFGGQGAPKACLGKPKCKIIFEVSNCAILELDSKGGRGNTPSQKNTPPLSKVSAP